MVFNDITLLKQEASVLQIVSGYVYISRRYNEVVADL